MTRPSLPIELDLTRADGDRRLYLLQGIGTIRLQGLLMRAATARSADAAWHFARHGFWQRTIQATASNGHVAGTFQPRDIRRGGILHWQAHHYTLRPDSTVRERYALRSDRRELALLEAKGWWGWGTRRPLRLQLPDRAGASDPGLLLFASFIVRTVADDANTTAGVAATDTTTSSAGSFGV
jgi:hypothetical protein